MTAFERLANDLGIGIERGDDGWYINATAALALVQDEIIRDGDNYRLPDDVLDRMISKEFIKKFPCFVKQK